MRLMQRVCFVILKNRKGGKRNERNDRKAENAP